MEDFETACLLSIRLLSLEENGKVDRLDDLR